MQCFFLQQEKMKAMDVCMDEPYAALGRLVQQVDREFQELYRVLEGKVALMMAAALMNR